jgi:two-component system sensor histidine kinase MprB
MTIRRRMSLAAAAAVAVAVALASTGAYLGVRAKLRGEVDSSLRDRASAIQQVAGKVRRAPIPFEFPGPPPGEPPIARFGGAGGVVQFVTPAGSAVSPPGANAVAIPIDPGVRLVARGRKGTTLADEHTGGQHLRVITAPIAGGGAIQVARPLNEVDSVLNALMILLAAITAGGIALAAVLGGLVSRASLGPIRRFTARTEAVAATPLLGQRLEVETDDELGRLARSSTRRSARSSVRSRPSGSSSPTRRTSCARRWPASRPTSKCCAARPSFSPRANARNCCSISRSRPTSSRCS